MYTAIGGTYAATVGTSSAWRGVISGLFYPGFGLYYTASYSYYWSSTVNSAAYARSLGLTTSSVNPASNDNKYDGLAMRCML
jgi:hypothetical protein